MHDDRYFACIHEAGHAIAAVRFEIPFSHVAIDDHGGGNTHTLRYRGSPGRHLAFELAGPVAELLYCRRDLSELFTEPHFRSDRRLARKLARHGDLDVVGVAIELLAVMSERSDEIVAVANALNTRGRLDRDEVMQVCTIIGRVQ